MLPIIELIMMTVGIYSIISGRIPTLLFGGGKYHVDGHSAQIFGIILTIPLPTAFLGGIFLSQILGEGREDDAFTLEALSIIFVALLATLFIRVVGEEIEPSSGLEEAIAKNTDDALMYAIFSAAGFASIVCCPLAFYYANQAVNLIDKNSIGEKHRGLAVKARAFALIMAFLWATAKLCFVYFYFGFAQ